MFIIDELKERGLIFQSTDINLLKQRMSHGPITFYCGFDPTADSMHIGNLIPILTMRRMQLAGHRAIALVGGGTGLIGDPGGRTNERSLNPKKTVAEWTNKLQKQLERFLDFKSLDNAAIVANNFDWIAPLDVISFLRETGKHFPINTMLAKESVQSRLEKGISYTEFSYMLLQAYDFLQLNKRFNCELQIGGSEQWGNITAGTDLIRRTYNDNKHIHALTLPLVTKSDGTKFGKSESGAIWLDATKTSPYEFYQFWLNVDDKDIINMLKYYTFLSLEQIAKLDHNTKNKPEERQAQHALADEVTQLVHGQEALERAKRITEALFKEDLYSLTATEIIEAFQNVPSTFISNIKIPVVELLVQVGAAKSKREARELMQNGGISLNQENIKDIEIRLDKIGLIDHKYVVIRRGRKKYFLAEIK